MSKITASKMVPHKITDDDGNTSVAEYVGSVTFTDILGAEHTLVFHPGGTDVSGEAEDESRIVGEDVPEHLFTDPRDAVTAFERGEV